MVPLTLILFDHNVVHSSGYVIVISQDGVALTLHSLTSTSAYQNMS